MFVKLQQTLILMALISPMRGPYIEGLLYLNYIEFTIGDFLIIIFFLVD